MYISTDTLVEDFARRLNARQAAPFIGAGLSRGSGLADWKGLLKKPAEDLGISIGSDAAFPDIAEFYAQKFSRGALIQHVWNMLNPLSGVH